MHFAKSENVVYASENVPCLKVYQEMSLAFGNVFPAFENASPVHKMIFQRGGGAMGSTDFIYSDANYQQKLMLFIYKTIFSDLQMLF